jgi:mannose-6-phosphate isomerase-like protein (cupin superfamily)
MKGKNMAGLGGIRRVVTTHDEDGKAVILYDAPTPYEVYSEKTGISSRLLWVTGSSPADAAARDDRALLAGIDDRGAVQIRIAPPSGGTVVRIVDYPPSGDRFKTMDVNHMSARIAEDDLRSKARPPSHPMMHRTKSVDYAFVLSGEITMILDDSEVTLKAGDFLVQQATNHGWENRGNETCRIGFVLIDAVDPLA